MESDNSEHSVEQFIPMSQTNERLLPDKVIAAHLSTFLDTTSSHNPSPNPLSQAFVASSRNTTPYNNNTSQNNTLDNKNNTSNNLISPPPPIYPNQDQIISDDTFELQQPSDTRIGKNNSDSPINSNFHYINTQNTHNSLNLKSLIQENEQLQAQQNTQNAQAAENSQNTPKTENSETTQYSEQNSEHEPFLLRPDDSTTPLHQVQNIQIDDESDNQLHLHSPLNSPFLQQPISIPETPDKTDKPFKPRTSACCTPKTSFLVVLMLCLLVVLMLVISAKVEKLGPFTQPCTKTQYQEAEIDYVKYVCHENICTCKNGLAEPACVQDNVELCQECNEGFTKLKVTNTNVSISFSWREDRMKSASPRLRSDFSWKISDSPENSGTYCLKNECSCENGVKSKITVSEKTNKTPESAVCYFHEQKSCESCNPGYEMSRLNEDQHNWGTICEPNICTCNHGTPVAQNSCLRNSEKCGECDDGYYLEDSKCRRNKCQCPDGNALTGGYTLDENDQKLFYCTQNGGINCASCDVGYSLLVVNKTHNICEDKCPQLVEHFDQSLEKCVKNVCTCLNGMAKKGCTEHNAEQCEPGAKNCKTSFYKNKESTACIDTCEMGNITKKYHYFDKIQKTCVKNDCKCNDGEPNQENCEFSGLFNCKSCSKGFHLAKDKYLSRVLNRPIRECLINTCECENGEASNFLNRPETIGDLDDQKEESSEDFENIIGCPKDGENHCAKCDSGFELDGNFDCVLKKVCTCNNGKREIGEICQIDKELCRSCDSGFKLISGKCKKISGKKKLGKFGAKLKNEISKKATSKLKKLKNSRKLFDELKEDMAIVNDFSMN